MYAIVGSGFGLYGYLPALVETLGERIVLPRSARAKIEARPELAPYLDAIDWVDSEADALAAAAGVAIATPPRRQQETVARVIASPRIATLFLEKPLAPTPGESMALLEALTQSQRRVRIGYTLLHAQWSDAIDFTAGGSGEAAIEWTFMAHHFAHDLPGWKRETAQGGGVLRFFGVHLLALLARAGYREVRASTLAGARAGEPERWDASFAGPGLPDCRVRVDSRSATGRFAITGADGHPQLDLPEPFAREPAMGAPGGDRRIAVLARLIGTLREDDASFLAAYRATHALWAGAERLAGTR